MIPTDVSGSRFPVGSSQTRSGGWLTNARAIETRCCSPPESSSGYEFVLCERPTMFRTSGTFRRIPLRLSPCTLSAYATFSAVDRLGRSLKSWKTQAGQVTAADDDPAGRRLELLEQQPHHRRLPRARWADEEDELALLDHE